MKGSGSILRLSFILVLVISASCAKSRQGKDAITIGAIASLTGPAGEQGKNWLEGAEAAVEALKSEGINVKLVVEDDQTEPAKVASAFTKLATFDNAKGIIGGTWDYLAETAYPLAKQYKIPFIAPTNPVEILSEDAKNNPYIFTSGLNLEAGSKVLVSFLKERKIRTLGLVYPNLPFGTSQAEDAAKRAESAGIKIALRHEFPVAAAMSDNMKLTALKIEKEMPDATFIVTDYNGLDLLTLEFKRLKISPLVITTQHLDQALLFSKDPLRYKNLYALYPKVKSSNFNELFQAKHSHPPKVYAAEGYDALMFLAKAIKKRVPLGEPVATFTYDGITGFFALPSPDRALVRTDAVLMTTDRGIFEEYHLE